MRREYPVTDPFLSDTLNVDDIHSIYYEVSGNPNGKAILHVHGGPGSASKPGYRQLYNPEKYKIVLFDQRGCGKSVPRGEVRQNTTQDIVEDIEKLRIHLDIEKWVINGPSWGSAIALVYAQKHPERVNALILRGVFLGSKEQVEWLTKKGANMLFPDLWERVMVEFNEDEDLLSAFKQKLNSYQGDDLIRLVEAWNGWESNLLKLFQERDFEQITLEEAEEERHSINIFLHYFENDCFLQDGEIIQKIDLIRNIPTVIMNGRYDVISTVKPAWELHKAWPEADFFILEDAGHHGSEKSILDKTIEYTDKYSEL
ncbi:prolyl aminopeptidase [Candidatus Dojkabacteria bacterium]|uniref:Proline iminopeptidase n=1 Tax=Candidatus Dojkabacteria bacterium TaxID=2099670 RepID=A0A955RJ00_9BACT|nr:prolyl aminopeptidase [Candidatus Dojkabacteria bacterium]